MPIPTDTIATLRSVWGSISELCADLDEEQWKRPTALPGWTVQDNLAHLVGTERMLQGLGKTGDPAPPADHVKNAIGVMNEQHVHARRGHTGAEVLAEWNELIAVRLATLETADEAYFAAEAMTPTGPGTLADFLHIRVLDNWAHEQDIRRALGRPGGYGSDAAAHTIDRLIRTLPIVVGKRAATPEGQAIEFDITGPVARHLVYEVQGGRAALVDTPTHPPAATIRTDADTFAALALGRQQAWEAADRVKITGDAELGRRAIESLNMMI